MYKIIIIGLFLFFPIERCATAANLHLIEFTNTMDDTLGRGIIENENRINDLFKNISDGIEFSYKRTTINGKDFSCMYFSTFLKNMDLSQDEIIVFYHAGHGYRWDKDTSIFPRFHCPENNSSSTLGLADVVQVLELAKPRLIIAISDSCNTVIPQSGIPAPQFNLEGLSPARISSYKKLMLKNKGKIVISSSSPGQSSWYYEDGGLFTSQFLQSFEKNTGLGKKGIWSDLISDATAEIVVPVDTGKGRTTKQKPQADLSSLTTIE